MNVRKYRAQNKRLSRGESIRGERAAPDESLRAVCQKMADSGSLAAQKQSVSLGDNRLQSFYRAQADALQARSLSRGDTTRPIGRKLSPQFKGDAARKTRYPRIDDAPNLPVARSGYFPPSAANAADRVYADAYREAYVANPKPSVKTPLTPQHDSGFDAFYMRHLKKTNYEEWQKIMRERGVKLEDIK